jgi:hypothetical protein
MIYRAYDCGIYDNDGEPLTCVWLEATSRAEVAERITALLSLAWGVDSEKVFTGGIDDEFTIAHNSLQEAAAGDRRWLEGGWTNGRPLYFAMPVLVFLTARNRRRLAKAAKAAQQHARELVTALLAESAKHVPDSREANSLNFDIRQYRDFADQTWLSEPNKD